jgi:ribonuclease P/MRP protein subunit RPP40
LSNPTQKVVLGKFVSDWKTVLSGEPQGSVLGPILFVIFIKDLVLNKINNCKLYAEDTKVISIIKP